MRDHVERNPRALSRTDADLVRALYPPKDQTLALMEADGKKLSRRDKGPLWLMYPISDHDELKDALYIHRLIWQVVRIESL